MDKKVLNMREQIKARLDELKREVEVGQTELQKLQVRENYLRETIMRINGAIQVLEELLVGAQENESKNSITESSKTDA